MYICMYTVSTYIYDISKYVVSSNDITRCLLFIGPYFLYGHQ